MSLISRIFSPFVPMKFLWNLCSMMISFSRSFSSLVTMSVSSALALATPSGVPSIRMVEERSSGILIVTPVSSFRRLTLEPPFPRNENEREQIAATPKSDMVGPTNDMFVEFGIHVNVHIGEFSQQIFHHCLKSRANFFDFFYWSFNDDFIGLVLHFNMNLTSNKSVYNTRDHQN